MQNARLDEAQAGIKIAGRNINNLRYADDTTLMAESTWIFNEYSELISFRIEWFDLFAVQGTLKSLLQHHSSKASLLQHSVFFMIQLSHPYTTTRKTIALTRWNFVGKVMSLLFNMLSRLLRAFLPRSKHLNCKAIVTICSDFGAPQNKSLTLFPLFSHLFVMKWWDRMPWS